MATMPATDGHNQACCNIPPVVTSGYVAKGSYTPLGGMKTYVSGPPTATKGIVAVFDIFGYVDQTLQGADILAAGGPYRVFLPDWFDNKPCPMEWYPPDTQQKQKDLGAWFGQHAPQAVAEAIPAYLEAAKLANPMIESWAIMGYCWGGKVVELVLSTPTNPFALGAVAHPAMLDPHGADEITVPFVLLASQEEAAADVSDFNKRLTAPHHVETFGDQIHGWMAARADLSDAHIRSEYRRGYQVVLDFFSTHWA